MFRRTVAGVAVSLAVVGAVAATSGSAQTPGGRTLTVTEKNKTNKTFMALHRHHRHLGAGDHIVLAQPLYDATGKTRIGMLRAVCTIAARVGKVEPPAICEGAYLLRDGAIVVTGQFSTDSAHLGIVGGTGAYAGARGTMTPTETKTGSTDVLTLLP